MGEELGPSPEEMGLGPEEMGTGESKRIESPELAKVLAEQEAEARANIEEAKKEGGERGSEENIKYLEAGMKAGLERREEQYRVAMEIADRVVTDTLKANEFGWDLDLSRRWSSKSDEPLKSGSHLTPLGQDTLRAIDFRTITKDENGRPIPKTLDIEGRPKMIVGMERVARRDPITRDEELGSINFKLIDAKANVAPRTKQYPEGRR